MKSWQSILLLGMTISLSSPAIATNGYQLIGVGANQKGMGGATTAVPLDAMTAISNPAGMGRIAPRADFCMEAFLPVRAVDFGDLGGARTEGGAEMYGIPSIGWVAPAFGSDQFYFGGGMFATSGLGVDYGQSIFMPGGALDQQAGAPSGTFQDVTFDGYSAIQFWKMAPTLAWNPSPKLSVGAALNIDYQSVTIRQGIANVPFWNNPSDPSLGLTQADVGLDLGRPTSQFGYGATLGLLYDLHDMITIGATYTSKQSFPEAEFRVGTGDLMRFGGAMGLAGTYEMALEFPQMVAGGIALRPMPDLTLAADIKWINWSETHDRVELNGPAGAFDTDGDGQGDAAMTELDFSWEDQTVIAVGARYAVNERLVLMAGFNHSAAPIDEADVFNNLILPAVVEQHISFGGHYFLGEHWGLGGTFMKASEEVLTGKGDVPAAFQLLTPFTADSGASISLEETSLDLQLTYRF